MLDAQGPKGVVMEYYVMTYLAENAMDLIIEQFFELELQTKNTLNKLKTC